MNGKVKLGLGVSAVVCVLGLGLYFGGVFDEKIKPPAPTSSITEEGPLSTTPKAAEEFTALLENLPPGVMADSLSGNMTQEEKNLISMLQQRVEIEPVEDVPVETVVPPSETGKRTNKPCETDPVVTETVNLGQSGKPVSTSIPVISEETGEPGTPEMVQLPMPPITSKPPITSPLSHTGKPGSTAPTSPVIPLVVPTVPVVNPSPSIPVNPITPTTTTTTNPLNELNSKDVTGKNIERPALPVVSWTPNPSNLKLTYLGRVILNIMDVMFRLEKAKTRVEMDAVVELAKSFLKSLVTDLKTFLSYNPSLTKKFISQMQYVGFMSSYAPAFMQTKALGLLIDQQVAPLISLVNIDWLKSQTDNARILVMVLLPLVNPFDSFAAFNIDDQAISFSAYFMLFEFIFHNNMFDLDFADPEAVHFMKKLIREPTFLAALKKVYAESEFSLLLAAKTDKEFFTVVSVMMKNLKSYPALMMLGSVLEESTVRILTKLLVRLLSDTMFDAPKKFIKKVLTLVQTFTIAKDYSTEVKALTNEADVFKDDLKIRNKLQVVFEPGNFVKEATELFGAEKAMEYWNIFQPAFLKLVEFIKEQHQHKGSEHPASIVRNLSGLMTEVGISMSMVVQLVTRLTSTVESCNLRV